MGKTKAIINPEIKRIDNRILNSIYTLQYGDDLVTIAKKNGLNSWLDVYNLNSRKIGPNPDNANDFKTLKVR